MITRITNIGSLITWSEDDNTIIRQNDIEILVEDGLIIKIADHVEGAEEEINADGSMLTPGFVDPHTHPVFYGNRANEFGMRVAGKTYKEIAAAGGGIISSIRSVREASEEKLLENSLARLNHFIFHGTTTIEAKSGYGLDTASELKSLRVIKQMQEISLLDIIPTFLGAHAFPPEFKDNHAGYVDLICEEMLPAVAEQKLAEFCDVFCEEGYFTVDQSRRILRTAIDYGLVPRLHADEFQDSGAAELAADLGAISADHLMAVSDAGIKALAKSNVIATLLPGTTLFLGSNTYAPGRKLIDSGIEVALASDFNPGSCTMTNIPLVYSLATLYCGLTINEAFKATTWNAARAVNRHHILGAIKEGYQADLLFWDCETLDEIPYWLGSDRIVGVMKKGILIEN